MKKSEQVIDELFKDKSLIREMYKQVSDATKQRLVAKFGKEYFALDYIDAWDEFLKEFKMDISLPFSIHTTDREEQRTNSFHMLNVIVPKERGSCIPDHNNGSQWKYEPRFDLSGSGFAYAICDYWDSDTYCGSRLCTPSWEECKRIAIKYLPIYERCYNK